MTLRNALKAGAHERPRRETTAAISKSTALAFAFDAEYLLPFRIMAYSMIRRGTLVDCPVYVYSDDEAVLRDPFVKQIADKIRLIEGRELSELVDVAENHIKRPERAKWNRGTCLKWAVFDEADVDQVLFLDVDMLVLRSLEGFLRLYPDADLVCCPQFQRSMMPAPDNPQARTLALEHLRQMIARGGAITRRINSGVMLVRKRLLSREFRSRLIDFARGGQDINEQSHLTNFMRATRGKVGPNYELASSSYNFQENYLESVDRVDALSLLQQVRILHYAGQPKPWRPKAIKNGRFSLQLWSQFELAAEDDEAFGPFGRDLPQEPASALRSRIA